MIYGNDQDGYKVAHDGEWLPGVYADGAAAEAALDVEPDTLQHIAAQFDETSSRITLAYLRSHAPWRVDPPECGCSDCTIEHTSVPIDQAAWTTIKAMLEGRVKDASGVEFDARVVVTLADERDQDDGQRWEWNYTRKERSDDPR